MFLKLECMYTEYVIVFTLEDAVLPSIPNSPVFTQLVSTTQVVNLQQSLEVPPHQLKKNRMVNFCFRKVTCILVKQNF